MNRSRRLPNFRPAYSPKLTQTTSIISILVGCLVLIGWQFDIEIFKTSLSPNLTTMKVNTALCFLLSGVSLWLQQGKRQSSRGERRIHKSIAQICALAVALVGLLTVSQYLFGWNLGIDQLLFRDSSAVKIISPGRMGLNTAVNFLLIGSTLLLLSQRNRRSYWCVQSLTLLATLIALQALIGYTYQVAILYGIAPYTSAMPLHTALTFIVFCVGLLWAHPDQGFMRVVTSDGYGGLLARRLLIAAIAIPLVIGWLILQAQRGGYYDPAFALSLFAIALIVIFVVLIWQNAALIEKLDSERQGVLKALRTNEEKLRSFVDADVIGILFGDVNGGIAEANNEFLRMIGYSREDLRLGRISWINITPPEYLPLDEERITEAKERGACTPYEKEYIRPDGSRVPVLIGYVLVGEEREESVAFILDLSDRKALEQAQQAANRQITNILESISDNFVALDRDLRITYVNQATAKLNGVTPEEMIGKANWEMWPWTAGSIFEQKYRQLLATGSPTHFEALYEPLNIWLEVHAYPAADGLSIYFRDVTQRKLSEAAIRESELNFRNLADTMPLLFWTTRADGYHEYFNQRWYDYTGMTLEQTQGWGWSHLLHPDDRQRCLDIWNESLRTGNIYNIEYRFQRASDGEYRWFLGRALPMRDQNGDIVKWFGTCVDIHEQKLVIEERDRLLASEQLARTQAETSNRLKDEFLAVVSHELRSPLNAMLGWVQMLRTGRLNETMTAKALETIERNARAQTQLIEDLLDVSRIITGKLRLNVRSLQLAPIIEAAIDTARPAADAKEIRLQPVLDPAAGPISGDSERLQQIVWNLLSNAIKFTPKKGRVHIRLERINSHVEITISDTGIGIKPEFLPYVFERFRQADSSSTRSYSGLGLGLAIVRHLLELHGGSVSVDSPGEGQGSTFTVMLPVIPVVRLETEEERVHPTISKGVPFDSPPALNNLRILVVDDEVDTRDFITTALIECGAQVKAVASAMEALAAIQQWQPDVLVSDIGMPLEDGYSLIRKVRLLPPHQGGRIPAVALTAYARAEDRTRALQYGFQMHLPKPVEPAELATVVASVAQRNAD